MCGIAGHLSNPTEKELKRRMVKAMTDKIAHRGPDGEGVWISQDGRIGLGHRRLSIIDVETGAQPMVGRNGQVVVFNGEIYNYKELREKLTDYTFVTSSDTEVLLAGYAKWGQQVVNHLRGMFAFAIHDPGTGVTFCARDPLGIKPFYFANTKSGFVFGSEVKALLPHLDEISVDLKSLKEYFVFQLQMTDRTLFEGVRKLRPGHFIQVSRLGEVTECEYWSPDYQRQRDDFNPKNLVSELESVLRESVYLHTRADVPIGAYISGGVDSSFVASMAREQHEDELLGFTGKFDGYDRRFDESRYARDVGSKIGIAVHERSIVADDFKNSFRKLVYHMDYPEAGPGAFPQYCVSELASRHRKVVLGGQGGDEIFGGYARYMVGLLESTLCDSIDGKAATDGRLALADIVPNLTVLGSYKPMMQGLFAEGLFGPIQQRYFKLVSRAPDIAKVVDLEGISTESSYGRFFEVLSAAGVTSNSSPMNTMMGFDLVSLLPGLLHVEDRVSMAWGLESRVPLVDRKVFEFAAMTNDSQKLPDGELKGLLRKSVARYLPESILERKDKMGFPTPLNIWIKGELRQFVQEIFAEGSGRNRGFYDPTAIVETMGAEGDYARNIWGLLNIEVWLQTFIDNAAKYRFDPREI